jgi:phosphoribosylformylglycinamidine synthase
MWASKHNKDANLLNIAVNKLVESVNYLGFSINGGKDSLSMSVDNITETIKSPNTLVLGGYTNCIDLNNIITPNLKKTNSFLVYINIGNEYNLGGTIFSDIYNKNINLINKDTNNLCDIKDLGALKNIFKLIQKYIKMNKILSGHDVSDGGLITTLCEMSISSNIGIVIDYFIRRYDYIDFFFNENPAIVIEVSRNNIDFIVNDLLSNNMIPIILGNTIDDNVIDINFNEQKILSEKIEDIRFLWEKTSYNLEKKQANIKCINQEIKNCYNRKIPKFNVSNELLKELYYPFVIKKGNKPKVAIFNEEGSNGENEMAYCFLEVGFDVYNININDLIENKYNLSDFKGIAFVGGFSFSDVLGAGYGWYFSIKNNKKISTQFDNFFNREDTFSLGVCNGCQLMSLLGWIPEGITLENNLSNRFESRYSIVKIKENNSIMLKNLQDTEFGIWSAHGQGRIVSKYSYDDSIFPINYLDDNNQITEKYPYNPNGSEKGRCAIVSYNGRHLAMMPHPERCVLKNQMSWIPDNIKLVKYTPWILMFRNAYEWCIKY